MPDKTEALNVNRFPLRQRNRIGRLMTVISLLAILNVLRVPVLCVGRDGHVAVEPAGHEHCAHAGHQHDEEAGKADVAPHCHVEGAPCRSCTDIPILTGVSESPIKSSDGITCVFFSVDCSVSSGAIDGDVGAASLGPSNASGSTYFIPLRSIVLQV